MPLFSALVQIFSIIAQFDAAIPKQICTFMGEFGSSDVAAMLRIVGGLAHLASRYII